MCSEKEYCKISLKDKFPACALNQQPTILLPFSVETQELWGMLIPNLQTKIGSVCSCRPVPDVRQVEEAARHAPVQLDADSGARVAALRDERRPSAPRRESIVFLIFYCILREKFIDFLVELYEIPYHFYHYI